MHKSIGAEGYVHCTLADELVEDANIHHHAVPMAIGIISASLSRQMLDKH